MTSPSPRTPSDVRTAWVRREPDSTEAALTTVAAFAVGAVVGAGVLYLSRMLVARDELRLNALPEEEGSPG